MGLIKEYLDNLKNGKLIGTRCKNCGHINIPAKPVCPECGSFNLDEFQAKGTGNIRSFTVIHVAPKKFVEKAPYVVAIVKLEEGPSIMGRLLGADPLKPDKIKIGAKVRFESLVENGEAIVAFRLIG